MQAADAGDRQRDRVGDAGVVSGAVDWARWFVVIGLVIGVASVFSVPGIRPLDEPAHLQRVATLANGRLVPPAHDITAAGYEVDGCLRAMIARDTQAYFDVRNDVARGSAADRWRERFSNPPCGPARALHGGGSISGTEVNTPLPYVPAVVGFVVGRGLHGAVGALYGARLVQLLAYVALCWLAIRRVPWGKSFLFCIALLPTAIGGASGVSADPMTLALALLATATVLRGIDRSETGSPRLGRGELFELIALFVALGLCKIAAVPLVVLVCAIPTGAWGDLRRRWAWTAATLGAVAITGGAWAVAVTSKVHVTTTPRVDSVTSARWLDAHLWTLPGSFLQTVTDPQAARFLLGGMVVPLGLDVNRVPVLLTIVVLLGVLAVRLLDPMPRRLATRLGRPGPGAPVTPPRSIAPRQLGIERGLGLAIAGAGTALIVYGIYVATNRPGSDFIVGIQGRYFLPYALLPLLGARPPRRRPTRPAWVDRAIIGGIVVLGVWWLGRLLSWWRLLP